MSEWTTIGVTALPPGWRHYWRDLETGSVTSELAPALLLQERERPMLDRETRVVFGVRIETEGIVPPDAFTYGPEDYEGAYAPGENPPADWTPEELAAYLAREAAAG